MINPLTGNNETVSAVLRSLAGQENCDGEPYDQMQDAADFIDSLITTTDRANEQLRGYKYEWEMACERYYFQCKENKSLIADARFIEYARELISRAEGGITLDQAYINYTKSQKGPDDS